MQIRCTQADHQNQYIMGFCIDSSCLNQRPYCNFCLPRHGQHLEKLTSFELSNEWIKQRILSAQNIQKNAQECKLALDSLLNYLIPFQNFDIQQFLDLGLSQIDNIIKGLCQLENCKEILFQQLKQSIEQVKQIIDQILKKIKDQSNQKDKCSQQFQKPDRKILILEQSQNQSLPKANIKQFTFELINQNQIKQADRCCAIAINNDQSIVLAGCEKDITVFQNQQGKLNQIQLLSENQNSVLTINFMKQQIILYLEKIGHNQWKCQEKLNGHSGSIFCLLLNNIDDLIISGSDDNTIKFWMKQNSWSCQQTITDHTNTVYSLSLNEQQNKLISCSKDEQILVIKYSQLNKQWSVIQKIKVNQYGCRLCFINDNLFTFQPKCKEQMYIFEMDTNIKQYKKTKEIQVKCGSSDNDCLFPQQYFKSKCLLENKNGNYVNLMRKKENGDFTIQQSIKFGDCGIFGQLSDDGEYLITWDNGSKQIQIRKCREL